MNRPSLHVTNLVTYTLQPDHNPSLPSEVVASSVGLKLCNIRRYDKFEFQIYFRVGYTHRNTLLPSVKVIVIRIRIPRKGGTRGLEGEKVGHEESGNPKPRNRAGESTSGRTTL